jgi:hypothetical protein
MAWHGKQKNTTRPRGLFGDHHPNGPFVWENIGRYDEEIRTLSSFVGTNNFIQTYKNPLKHIFKKCQPWFGKPWLV